MPAGLTSWRFAPLSGVVRCGMPQQGGLSYFTGVWWCDVVELRPVLYIGLTYFTALYSKHNVGYFSFLCLIFLLLLSQSGCQ